MVVWSPCFTKTTSFSPTYRDGCDISDADYSFFYYDNGEKVRRLNGYIEKCGYKITKETTAR